MREEKRKQVWNKLESSSRVKVFTKNEGIYRGDLLDFTDFFVEIYDRSLKSKKLFQINDIAYVKTIK